MNWAKFKLASSLCKKKYNLSWCEMSYCIYNQSSPISTLIHFDHNNYSIILVAHFTQPSYIHSLTLTSPPLSTVHNNPGIIGNLSACDLPFDQNPLNDNQSKMHPSKNLSLSLYNSEHKTSQEHISCNAYDREPF